MKEIRQLNFVFMPLFLLMVVIGIAMFFVRERLMPDSVGHELSMGPETSKALIATDQFLVLIHPLHLSKLKSILEPLGLEIRYPLLNWIAVGRKDGDGAIVPLSSEKANISRLIVSALLSNPLVLDAHHNFFLEPTANEPWPGQHDWHLFKNDSSPFSLNLNDAWRITRGSKNVTIAVVDEFSMMEQFNFAQVFPNCASRVTFFSPLKKSSSSLLPRASPHGEPLLQALGACNNVAPFSTGVDHEAAIIAAEPSTLSHADVYLTALLTSGIDICTASVIPCPANLALPLSPKQPDVLLLPLGNNAPELLQISADMMDAIKRKGVIVVTGAGNDQANGNSFFPGASTSVINVGAINKSGMRATFSNWGEPVDIFAPGDDIDIAYPNGLKSITGTSIAAAYTAGSIALLKAMRPDLSFEEARYVLLRSGQELSCEQYCNDDERCRELCCDHNTPRCDRVALDLADALRFLAHSSDETILKLEQSYFVYLRDEPSGLHVEIKNVGGKSATVKVTAFDEQIDIAPKEFTLNARDTLENLQTLKISFKREPFTRQIFKFAVNAYHDDVLADRAEFFVEYVPRR